MVFSQYLLGGGASFHRNLLSHLPDNTFDLKVIYLFPRAESFTPSIEFVARAKDVIFEYGDERLYDIARRLSSHISDEEGVIVTNLGIELDCLDLFPKRHKTVYFICHDSGFLAVAEKYAHLIDVFIAHNSEVFMILKKLLSSRLQDIYFIPHGVTVQQNTRAANTRSKLQIAFLARHHKLKGIYDLLDINKLVANSGIDVEWLIMGDGPERNNFIAQTSLLPNFRFAKPATNSHVLEALRQCDIFILPSRKDGLPVALLEAMSVGCVPLVSAFSEGIRDVVNPDVGRVINAGDNKGFADGIIELHRNRESLLSLSKASMNAIRQHYDIRNRAKQYFDLYADYARHRKGYRGNHISRVLRIAYQFFKSKIASKTAVQLKRRLFNASK